MRKLPFGMTPRQYEERYHKCHACGCELNEYYMPKKQEIKMTRDEAVKKVTEAGNYGDPLTFVKGLEALGLLKFEEPKKSFGANPITLYQGLVPGADFGNVKLELWTEGLVLWVGGQIVWKSWEKYYKKGDHVQIDTTLGSMMSGYLL